MRSRLELALISLVLVGACEPTAIQDGGAPDAHDTADGGPRDAGTSDAGPPHPATLSETGLLAADGTVAPTALSYDVRYPLWSDGSTKRRYLLLPEGTSIDTSDPDGWRFPVGARLFKEFSVDGRPIETRMLHKVDEGEWVRVAYLHRPDGSDADAVPDGATDALGTAHDVPDRADCFQCHRGAPDFVLGVSAFQLDRASFDAWVAAGVLSPDAPFAEPPGDEAQRDALGYLAANCGHCHNDRHPLSMHRALRLDLRVGVTDPLAAPAWRTSAGRDAFHELEGVRALLTPGDPEASQLYRRMGVRDEIAMPPLGTERVDEVGRAAVSRWILDGR